LPPPIEIGWVNDAPTPVVEIVSVGADETTDVSVVGKFPTAVPFAFTPGAEGVVGVVDETTDVSSVGNRVADFAAVVGDGDAAAAAIGEGSGDSAATPLC
jgi:hypothetical protein